MYAITVEYFFKVYDAEMWGGVGSIGYCSDKFSGIYPLANTHDDFEKQALRCATITAKELGVDPSKVEVISEEEYQRESGDEECEDEDWDDEEDYDGPYRH